MKYVFLYLVFLFISCSHNDDLFVIDIHGDALTQADISEIAEKVAALPLETNPDCLLSNIYSLRISDSLLFILSDGEIFQFHLTGRFLKKIIGKGRGPGEMPLVVKFELDENNKELIVYGGGGYVIRCKYDGSIVQQMRFKHPNIFITDFTIFADRIWAIGKKMFPQKDPPYSICLLTLNKQWSIQDSVILYTPDMPPTLTEFGRDYFSIANNQLFVHDPSLNIDRVWRDTLYRIDSDLRPIPVLRLNFTSEYNHYRTNASPFDSGYPLAFESIRINHRFLLVTSYFDQKEKPYTFYTFCYDFNSQKKYRLKNGFNDDFYGTGQDVYLTPLDAYHDEYYYTRETDELPPDYLPKRTESDNPVLYIVTLKK